MPSSIAPSTQSNSEDSPASCPAVRGSPRCFAQRPLPSITIATCFGTLSAGICGGRTPDGCGFGCLTSRLTGAPVRSRGTLRCSPERPPSCPVDQRQGAQAALQVPLQHGRHQPAALPAVDALTGLG